MTNSRPPKLREVLGKKIYGKHASEEVLQAHATFLDEIAKSIEQPLLALLPEKTDRFTDPTDWVGINVTIRQIEKAIIAYCGGEE